MTQDTMNSGINSNKNGGSSNALGNAVKGNSYDDNCLPEFNAQDNKKGSLNKTNISMISAQSMSQLSN